MPANAAQAGHATVGALRRTRRDLCLQLRIGGKPYTIAHTITVAPGSTELGNEQKVDVLLPPLPRGQHAIESACAFSIFPFGSVPRATPSRGTRRSCRLPRTR